MKYIILGVTKCGTTSLIKYLEGHGHDVIRAELAYWDRNIVQVDSLWRDRQAIFILRRDKEAWVKSLNTFNNTINKRKTRDKEIDMADPEIIKKRFGELNPEIVYLEDMLEKAGFPHLNKTPNE